jgi:hypothetical protein
MRVEKEVVDEIDLVKEGMGEAGGVMGHLLKVGMEKEVGDHLDLAEEGLTEAAGMISSAHWRIHLLKVGLKKVRMSAELQET